MPAPSTHAPPILEELFDALSHFDGELPAMDRVRALVARDARIVDGALTTDRRAWALCLGREAARSARRGEGAFFMVREACAARVGESTEIAFVVEEWRTAGGAVTRARRRRGKIIVSGHGEGAQIRSVMLRAPASSPRRARAEAPARLPEGT